ncbi:ClC family H(+)/Cl(-) exchange transporter, partial [Enterobacter hormaechei]|nr:ClC family H(+)/Cl(-) exchange transporter [Enterobacter hormaechei]
MNENTPSFEQQQFTRAKRRVSIRRLLNRDKTPLAILLAAAVVGTLAGLVGVAFEKAVNAVLNWRIGTVASFADREWLVWVWAFGLSALFAMVGYFLVRKFAPEAGGSGIPEIEGALEELRPV